MQPLHILLRPWSEADAPRLFELASDPEVGPRAGWQPHQSLDESLHIIRTLFLNPTTWAITLADGTLIGAIGYGPSCNCGLPALPDEPLVGYWIGRPYWNRGYCTAALAQMITLARRDPAIRSLISAHFLDNPASGRVMEHCGFTPTGQTSTLPTDPRPVRILRLHLRPAGRARARRICPAATRPGWRRWR